MAGQPAGNANHGQYTWMKSMEGVAMELFRALAIGLGHDYHYFDDTMSPDPYSRMKISRYPAQPEGPDTQQGLGLHHDSGLFTFILQNEVIGLQVMRDGDLHDVIPVPGTFIVNLGEMFQMATKGFPQSHQAPGEKSTCRARAHLDRLFHESPARRRVQPDSSTGQICCTGDRWTKYRSQQRSHLFHLRKEHHEDPHAIAP